MSEKKANLSQVRPDAWLDPISGVRIYVQAWESLCRVDDQYIERVPSLRMLFSYLRHVGVAAVVRKIFSRRAEKSRNEKFVAIGTGIVLGAGGAAPFEKGDEVVFLAPNHPETPVGGTIVDDHRFVRPRSWLQMNRADGDVEPTSNNNFLEMVERWKGWSSFSGFPAYAPDIDDTLCALTPRLMQLVKSIGSKDQVPQHGAGAIERIEGAAREGSYGAVVFGLGNYAKTQIIPTVKRELGVACVHEIDPDQFGSLTGKGITLDSSPFPRPDERYKAWFISGYHHTHAPIAIEALTRQSYAVVEKPLATTLEHFDSLSTLLEKSPVPRLFACFQKRYSKLHDWACEDLACRNGEPVDMTASVFEIPLPRAHWYNWPVSGSRMTSNGCHWLDYFMHINGYSGVADAEIRRMRGGDLLALVCLQNEARLVLSLTDTGSARLGVREFVELRHLDRTVRIADAKKYESENTSRTLRQRTVNPVNAYRRMYESICRRILMDEPGDPVDSLRSTALMLKLEEQLGHSGSVDARAESTRDSKYSYSRNDSREGIE